MFFVLFSCCISQTDSFLQTFHVRTKCTSSIASPQSQRSTGYSRRYGKPVEVTFEPAGKMVIAEQGDLLEAVAKKAGVVIPFKCKQGRCNSCEVRINGRVSAKVCQGAAVPGGPTKKLSVVVVNKKPL